MNIKSIWDNEGSSFDRYTIVLDEEWCPGQLACLGCSDHPQHAQGFGQHSGCQEGEHLGKKIQVSDLPTDVQYLLKELKYKEV